MSTRNNIDIYEDIARLGESVKEQDRIGWQKIEEAWQKLQKYCNEKTINFGRYLTDSKMTIDYLVNECCKPGAFSLLVAPCDSGKTKTILEEFATAILDDHNLAITTPTTLQSEQNAKMYFATGHNGEHFKTKAITGASRETINLSLRNAYSVVFDSVKRLEQKSDEELKKLVLVVDEAHQFETAKSYRNPTILMLWRVVNRVLAAGGSVIFMTGTPSKILALPYNNRATFVQGDVNLSRDSASLMRPNQKHNYGKIEVIRTDSHEFNMPELIASTMAKLILEGKTPFVRINDKNSIAAVAHALALSGKKIITLTADDKGCKFVETNQGREIIYDSPVYANIMNKGVISKCDGFITTSLLEVGTSIKGIEDEDGTVLQPETMVPIFACMNPTDCDTDAMEQFFARLRFPFEEAMILMNTPEERKYSS